MNGGVGRLEEAGLRSSFRSPQSVAALDAERLTHRPAGGLRRANLVQG